MTTSIVASAYQELYGLVSSVDHGRPRTLSLVESTLEIMRVFVPSEIASQIDRVLSAPTVASDDDGDLGPLEIMPDLGVVIYGRMEVRV